MNLHRSNCPHWKGLQIALVSLGVCAPMQMVAGQEAKPATQSQSTATATAEPSEETAQKVRKLLRELDGAQLKDRDAAEKSLIELGAVISPYLPKVDANTSGEMKIRLERIRQQLQQTAVVAFFDESKISLSGKMSLSDVLKRIQDQTGNTIEIEENAGVATKDTMIELDVKELPFWQALDIVLDQSNLRINNFGTTQAMSLIPGNEDLSAGPKPVTSGPFRIGVSTVHSTLNYGTRLDGQLELSLLLTWEPRLRPVFMQIPMASIRAVTDDGAELSPTSPEAYPEVSLTMGGCSSQIDLQLQRPDRKSQKIRTLSGEFSIAIPGERHKYVFKKFGNGSRQSEKFGEVTVTLEGARRNGAVYEMRVLVEFGNAEGALDSFRGWILSNEAYLLDPKDRRLENVGFQTYQVANNSVGVGYLFQINGNPDEFQLVYESPAAITRQTVKYELQDIDLP